MDCPEYLKLIYEKGLILAQKVLIVYYHVGKYIDLDHVEWEDHFWIQQALNLNGILYGSPIIKDDYRYLQFEFPSVENLENFKELISIFGGNTLIDQIIQDGNLESKPSLKDLEQKISDLKRIHCQSKNQDLKSLDSINVL